MSAGGGFVPQRFVLGEFPTTDALLEGARRMRVEKGHKAIDTHTPYPVHGIEEALGLGRPKVPLIVLLGAIVGAFTAYAMIYYMNVMDFPINIGNRPPHSPILNIPITFELAILLGGCSSFLGTLALAGMPQPYHPLFESEAFRRASIDAFFVSVEVPAGSDPGAVMEDLREVGGTGVEMVEEAER